MPNRGGVRGPGSSALCALEEVARVVADLPAVAQVDALLRGRRSVRVFGSGIPPEEGIREALEDAVYVPNHRRTQPWRFVVTRGGALARLAARAGELKVRPGGGDEQRAAAERTREELQSAAYGLAVLQKESTNAEVREEDYAACILAAHQASLALWARGVAVRWSSGRITSDAEVRALLGADADERVAILCYLGYPQALPSRPAPDPAHARTIWLA